MTLEHYISTNVIYSKKNNIKRPISGRFSFTSQKEVRQCTSLQSIPSLVLVGPNRDPLVFGGAHKLIGNLIDKVLNPINQNLQKLNKNIEDWNEWHKHANKRFENGDKHFIRHDEQLRDHERRITNLEEQNK